MDVKTIYLETNNDTGKSKVSILVNKIWYVAIIDHASSASHYVELDNCVLNKDLLPDVEMKSLDIPKFLRRGDD